MRIHSMWYRQYAYQWPSDAAVVRIHGAQKALEYYDCNSAIICRPYKGAMIAVCEAARNIVAVAQPVAITNC